jgi:Secretion system C-terminal sorting domain
MIPGIGYVMQAGGNGNGNDHSTPNPINFNYQGPYNSGTISIPVTAGQYTLAGNPYSDFLDLDSFLLDPDNVNTVNGPAVFWVFNTNIQGSGPFTYTDSDYAMYNVLGGCASGSNIYAPTGTNGNGNGVKIPNGKVQYGTGFFIEGRNSGTATFKETMHSSAGIAQGFKNSSATALVTPPDRHRIWLNIEEGLPIPSGFGSFGVIKQLLIGYAGNYGSDIPSAADNDRVFDAEFATVISNPAISFYSLAVGSTKKLSIQGRNIANFTTSDYFQLGFSASGGNYRFTATADGMFGAVPYMIWDNGIIHTLPYTTFIPATPFATPNNTRFRIVFSAPAAVPVNPAICGTTLTLMSLPVNTTSNLLATQYYWEVRNTVTNETTTFYTPSNSFWFRDLTTVSSTFFAYGTLYEVHVATIIGGATATLSTQACWVTTPLLGIYNNYGISGGGTFTGTQKPTITADVKGVTATLQNFCWIITRTLAGVTSTRTIYTLRSFFSFSGLALSNSSPNGGALLPQSPQDLVGFIVPNAQYSVTVQKINVLSPLNLGNPSPATIYNTSSTFVTTKSDNSIHPDFDFDATVAPNPFSNNFTVNIQSPSAEDITIKVYDMIGKLVDEQTIESINISDYQVGKGYATGVYNVIISQGENRKVLRVVKR